MRAALYLASWSAVRVPGRFKDAYQRMLAAGKPRQVALIAIARRLLLALNEMMRSNTPWRALQDPISA